MSIEERAGKLDVIAEDGGGACDALGFGAGDLGAGLFWGCGAAAAEEQAQEEGDELRGEVRRYCEPTICLRAATS
ncbi:MAG: hypothetical protein B7Z37_20215 [Verrucomicrobia bacterium 12-59-8]|nr:MAG: hypothetical protein B7Z37_20215 [Verrucomicrobia bacterium 12-59-8]